MVLVVGAVVGAIAPIFRPAIGIDQTLDYLTYMMAVQQRTCLFTGVNPCTQNLLVHPIQIYPKSPQK